jgi:amidohydrolase
LTDDSQAQPTTNGAVTGVMRNAIATIDRDVRDEARAVRRRLHMHPELSGEEARTAVLVAERLLELGVDTITNVGGYGVVGILEGARPGPTIAYRADMDALPMRDALKAPYASLHLAIKHACGHDAHTAIALGVARLLSRMREDLPGRVAFVFQPAEESLDGARAMLDDGLLELVRPDAILALHAFPLQVGTIGLATARCLAGMEEFRVRFYAPAGDLDELVAAAMANLTALSTASVPMDAVSAARVIAAMRRGDPELSTTILISCWAESSGQAPAPQAQLLGLISIPDFALRPQIHAKIAGVLDRTAARSGAAYDLDYTFSSPPLINDTALVRQVAPILEARLGPRAVQSFGAPYPFAHEDFARYAAEVPALFIYLGTQNLQRGIPSILHTPDYDIDEAALDVGLVAMTTVIRALLEESTALPR